MLFQRMSYFVDEQVTHGRVEDELPNQPQVTSEDISCKDVVEVQPLFCLNEVSGGTRHQNLRQCLGSASSKLPLLHS